MNSRTEQRLRAAFAAKAEQVTEDRLTARRQLPVEGFEDGSPAMPGSSDPTQPGLEVAGAPADAPRADPNWRAHWIAPALAAAAVAAVAARAQRPPNSSRVHQAHAQPDQSPEPDSDA